MRGFIRFLLTLLLLAAVIVLIVIPLAAGPLLTNMVRDMGLRSDSLSVSLALFDPTLVVGRSRSVHVSARAVDLPPAKIGALELTLGDVSLLDRTWQTVDGTLENLTVAAGGQTFSVQSLTVSGPAKAAQATARLTSDEVERLILFAARRQGLEISGVRVTDSGVQVIIAGSESEAALSVAGGALVLVPGRGAPGVPLIQPAPSDAWRLEEAWISDGMLNVRGVVDATRLARSTIGAHLSRLVAGRVA